MKKVTRLDRLHYKFDNLMTRGTIAIIVWLFMASAAMILVSSLLVFITRVAPPGDDGSSPTFAQLVWMNLMRTLDAGTMGGDVGSWPFLFAMLAITLVGIFIVSILIGVLTSGIEHKLEELRKGRSLVVETGHTVILGWSPQVFYIISELVLANANQRDACIAILAEKDKVAMEDEIHSKVGSTRNTRLVCRTGSPIDLTDLEIINPHCARAIIILSPPEGDADSQVIKTVLALTNNPHRWPRPYHLVAELRHSRNREIAQLVGGNELEIVLVDELIARMIAQTCSQPGLSVVYDELLDFSGDEIYFHEEPELVGQTFGQALLAYEDSALIGLRLKDGRVQLNPAPDAYLEAGDRVIVISADDNTVRLSGLTDYAISEVAIRGKQAGQPSPVRTLILGWNHRGVIIINELDYYVPPGSEVTIVTDSTEVESEVACGCVELQRQAISCQAGNTTDRRTLERLGLDSYQHIVILSYSDTLDPQAADARTLVTLLHLRHIALKMERPFTIVSEILDVRNRELAEVTHADDFIVSNKLVSLMLAQLSENKELAIVFDELFGPQGAELYLKPAEAYVQPGQPVNFYTVVEAARRGGEVAIGYRLLAEANQADRNDGVRINPVKSQPIIFAPGDCIIVLAEE